MHAFGGLYLDIDVECFTTTDHLLQGYDIVLQLEDKDPKSMNNGETSSKPSVSEDFCQCWCVTVHMLAP